MYALEHFEEIDDQFRRRQKRKLGGFIASAAATLAAFAASIALGQVANAKATDNYSSLLDEAARITDYEERLQLYEQAIAVPNKGGINILKVL